MINAVPPVFSPVECIELGELLRLAETYCRDTARTLDHRMPASPMIERLQGYAERAALLRSRLE